MRYSVAAAALIGAVAASGPSWGHDGGSWGGAPPSNGSWPVVYTTEVVTAFTTYCPEATALTHNGVTYTVSSATTLTISDCPCTVTKPVSSSVITSCASSSAASPTGTGVVVGPGPVVKPSPSGTAPKGTAPVGTASSWTGIPTPSSSPITPSKGDASQLQAGAAAILAVVGLVAAL